MEQLVLSVIAVGYVKWYNHFGKQFESFILHCYVKSLQLCPTLCDPMDYSLPGSSVCGIFQERILEYWTAISSSRGSSRPRDQTRVSYVSCIGRQTLYHQHHLGSPFSFINIHIPKSSDPRYLPKRKENLHPQKDLYLDFSGGPLVKSPPMQGTWV